MRKPLTVLILTLLISFDAYGQWTLQSGIMPNPGSNPSISVAGPTWIAVAGGPTGVPSVYKSFNSGNNLVQMPMPGVTREMDCIWMKDTLTYFVGDGGAAGGTGGNACVYMTTNGGLNWTVILQTGGTAGFINGIVFSRTNPQFGIVQSDPPTSGGVYYIAKTVNGGLNWTIQNPPASGSASAQNSIVVIDSNFYGFGLNSTPNRVDITTDGGTTWNIRNLVGLTGTQGFISGLAFSSDKIYGIAGDNSVSSTISRTTNGGVNWFSQTIPSTVTSGYFSAKWVPGTSVVYLISSSATATVCLKSTDNGATWTAMTMPATSNVHHMDLIKVGNVVYAYAINTAGFIYKLIDNLVGINDPVSEIPNAFSLNQNYPNPFNPETNISFNIAKTTRVRLAVYDILGKEVSVLKDEIMNAGKYSLRFDASNLRSGVYYYKLISNEFTDSKKMILVK